VGIGHRSACTSCGWKPLYRKATINSQISNLKSADLDWKHPGYKPSVQPVNQQKNLVSDQRTDLCLRRFRVTSILQFF